MIVGKRLKTDTKTVDLSQLDNSVTSKNLTMEPEGQVLSSNASYNEESLSDVSRREDPSVERAEIESLQYFEKQERRPLPYETSRTDTMKTLTAISVQAGPRPCSLFLCDTPSYDDDDNSSLSSHSVPDLRKSYAFVESTSNDDDYDEYDLDSSESTAAPDDSTMPITTVHTFKFESLANRDTKSTKSFPRYSLFLGLIVGCFIQSSSLGANYVLTVLFGHDFEDLREHHHKIMMFSLIWSLATSTMGVLVVLFLRSLLSAVPNASRQTHLNLWHVEYSFAFGALAGVCLAWCGTDVLLGFQAHALHSLLTLLFAVLAKTILSCMARGAYRTEQILLDQDFDLEGLSNDFDLDDDDDRDEYHPFMLENALDSPFWQSLHTHFKVHGTILGVLIGFFIQMSSLGASFLLDTFGSEQDKQDEGQDESRVALSSDGLLVFSLGWSFVFGTMGVMILLVLRRLLTMVCSDSSMISRRAANRLGLLLEFYFAVGCLVGVNLAWVLTDLGLGLQAHVMRSTLTLGVAAIWCRILACCFFSHKDDEEEEQEEDYGNVVLVDTQNSSLAARQQQQQAVEVYEAVLLV